MSGVADVFNSRAMPIGEWCDFVTADLPADMARSAKIDRGSPVTVLAQAWRGKETQLYPMFSRINFNQAERRVALWDIKSEPLTCGRHAGVRHAWRVAQHARDHGYTHMILDAMRRSGGYVWAKAGFDLNPDTMKPKDVDLIAWYAAYAVNQLAGLVDRETLEKLNLAKDVLLEGKQAGRILPGTERVLWPLADLPGMVDHAAYKARHHPACSRFESPMTRDPKISVAGYALLDSKWRGIMRFDDEAQMAKFEAYALS